MPVARSLAGTVAPTERAHAWRAGRAFREDPTRQCAHMHAYLSGYYSTRRYARNVHAMTHTRRDIGAEILEVLFSSFSPL